MCDVLEVSRSGYYAWLRRTPSPRQTRTAQLTEEIRQVHAASRQIYGSPRVHRQLQAQGVKCSENTVAKLMRQCGIRSKRTKKFRGVTTDSRHGRPIAANTLDRRFARDGINEAWVADITYIPTREGWLYLAAILDLCSRKVVGWAAAGHLRAELVAKALQMALRERTPNGPLLHHSDRGVQYACDEYQAILSAHRIEVSMSRRGDCYDNAVMESFFSTLKQELVHHADYATREAARQSLFEYIEVFYNRQRLHSALGYVSPHSFEVNLN
jgi:transposase InsO family protein